MYWVNRAQEIVLVWLLPATLLMGCLIAYSYWGLFAIIPLGITIATWQTEIWSATNGCANYQLARAKAIVGPQGESQE